ncbi:hypothetical protein BMETH_1868194513, partial [methanotrophic bacterial endosymbiont of Bathymodiolus sp.]
VALAQQLKHNRLILGVKHYRNFFDVQLLDR